MSESDMRGWAAPDFANAHPGYGMNSLHARLLLLQQRAIDVVGEPDAAGLCERFRIFLGEERAPHAGASAAAERALAIDAGHHLAEHRVEEHGLEVCRLRARLGAGFLGDAGIAGGAEAGRAQCAERVLAGERPAHAEAAEIEAAEGVARRRHDGGAQRAAAGREAQGRCHHITSMSAWMAPDALMA